MVAHKYLIIKSLKFVFVLLTAVLIANSTSAQNLVVKRMDPSSNPLVDSIVGQLVGSGVIVENIKSNLSESSSALGTFKAPPELLGIPAGLIMVTGVSDTMSGANTGGVISGQIPYADTVDGCSEGRQMLNSVLKFNGTTTRATDCATIQFDIIPATDSIKFNYVFASEEYNTFVCSNFNDIFGFFIKGPGIAGDLSLAPTFQNTKNIAIIPGTNLPVSINTVNDGTDLDPDNLCTVTPQGIDAYIDNTLPANNPFIYQRLKFNGLTQKLTAGVKVIPCQTYTLTLTVSDVSDRAYDSGVFIEKGSLRSSGVTAVQSSVFSARFPYAIVDCNPGKFIFERCANNTIDPLTARYKLSGTAVNGVDYMRQLPDGTLELFPDSFKLNSGTSIDSLVLVGLNNPTWENTPSKTVVVKFLNSTRPYINGIPNLRGDSATLILKRKFVYNAGPDIKLCNGSDTLVQPSTFIINSDRYRWRAIVDGDTVVPTSLSCTDCAIPTASPSVSTSYVVFIQDSISNCLTNDTINFDVRNVPTLEMTSDAPGNAACRNSNVSLFANPVTADTSWRYQWQAPGEGNLLIGNENTLKTRQIRVNIGLPQYYHVIARNTLGCTREDSLLISILEIPDFDLPSTDTVCFKTPYAIKAYNVKDSVSTRFSWRVKEGSITRVIDSNQTGLVVRPAVTGFYILKGENSCFANNAAEDTFHLVVIDSISAAHTYALVNDDFTVAPVQFTTAFYPQSFSRIWALRNLNGSWDTTLLGGDQIIQIRKGGDYESNVIVSSTQGSHYCADTVSQKFTIQPLGTVFVPNLVLENGSLSNATFIVTARGENNEILRNITEGKLTIYNRWGKKVYEKDNYNNDLDSKKLKDDFTDGVYFFEYSVARYNYKNGGWLQIQQR